MSQSGPPAGERFSRTLDARSSRAHGRRTLAALLEAALEELASHGYHGARMARIARLAGTAHGTLYVYFSSKDDLLAALHEEVDAELQVAMLAMPALEPGPGGYGAIRRWTGEVCEVFQCHGVVLQAVAEALSDEESSTAGLAALRSLEVTSRHLAGRVRAAGAPGLDPMIAALCIFAIIEGSNRSVFRGEVRAEPDELATGLAAFVHGSVFGTSTGRPGDADDPG